MEAAGAKTQVRSVLETIEQERLEELMLILPRTLKQTFTHPDRFNIIFEEPKVTAQFLKPLISYVKYLLHNI